MKFQRKPGYCGLTAVTNALRCFGKKVPERLIKPYTDFKDGEGTSEAGIKAGIEALGHSWNEIICSSKEDALQVLDSYFPAILCVEGWTHWITVVGKVQSKYIVVDPTRTKRNQSENGVHIVSAQQLLKRWRCKAEKNPYYGIQILWLPKT